MLQMYVSLFLTLSIVKQSGGGCFPEHSLVSQKRMSPLLMRIFGSVGLGGAVAPWANHISSFSAVRKAV